MVFFLGILSPGFGKRAPSDEAPSKTAFFGSVPDATIGAVPLSRAEQDSSYLGGKSWDTDPIGSELPMLTEAFPRFTL